MKNTIVRNDTSAKKNHQMRCCHCSSALVIRNGTYPRNDPQKDTEIRVQRYLCKSPKCPWQSFSVLPSPILPVIRHTYKALFSYSDMFQNGMNQVAVARKLNLKRGVVKRLKIFCHQFMVWLDREKKVADWGWDPFQFWQDFTRDFSQYFFPKRWLKPPSTQHIPVY